MDSEDPSPLNPLQAPFCSNLVNRLTQEPATLFPPLPCWPINIAGIIYPSSVISTSCDICPSDDISATRVICCCNSSWPGNYLKLKT